MPKERADSLIHDLKDLASRLKACAEKQTDQSEAGYFAAAARLAEQKIARLSTIQDGAAKTPETHIFDSVAQLRRNLIEIGADLQADPEIPKLVAEIVKKAAS